MHITVASANLDSYDTIKDAPTGPDVHAFLHTDRPLDAQRAGWTAVERANDRLSPRYLSKGGKCTPHLVGFEGDDVLWIDGSLQWTGRPLEELFALVPPGGVGCYRHRVRNTVLEEAAVSATLKRYRGQPVLEQAAHYEPMLRDTPWSDQLFETGIVVWRGAQFAVGVRWAAEMLAWSDQDQISLPHAARTCGVAITPLSPGTVVNNPWFVYVHHTRNDW